MRRPMTAASVDCTHHAPTGFNRQPWQYLSANIKRLIKEQGLVILTKITGLVLAALAGQIIMTGVLGFLKVL